MRKQLRLVAAPFLGALAVGGFYPFEFWIFPLISLTAVMILAENLTLRDRIPLFYLYGVGFLAPLLHWSSTYVGALPWLILSFGFASFFIILALGYENGRLRPLAIAAAFVTGEGLRAIVPFGGFGWGRFGFSQLDGPFQVWIRIGGVSLAGFLLAFTAAILARRNRYSLLVLPIFLMGAFVLPPATAAIEQDSNVKPIRVGLIQGGVSQLGLEFNATPQEVFNRHIAVTEKLLQQETVDFILWPENASDIDPVTNGALNQKLNAIARRSGTPLIIGAVTQSPLGPENVSLMFDGGTEVVSRYQKRDLVPFGEFVPLRNIAARISSLTDSVRDFVPGREVSAHSIKGISFAPLICYEILDDRVTYQNLEKSNIGVVQTNNATFGRSWQSGQQFQITRVRAFESRMPFVVAATTGDTAFISASGEVISKLTKFDPGSMVVEVSATAPNPPLIPPELMLASACIALGATRFRLVLAVRTKIVQWMR